MKIANIDFPKPLLNALRDGKLVVFAGAGVSIGEPACLPSFKDLANKIAEGTGKSLQDREPIDRFLGQLQHDRVKVHTLAAKKLSLPNLQATDLHRNLLRLYSKAEQVRVVTTNFDLLFEQAAKDAFTSNYPEVFRAPALPLGHQFNGIVHIHGAVNHSDEMIITDADFGRAYLTEGWARRFLVDLFRSFTVLFVGYSHDDTIMNYLARALPVGASPLRFVLIGETDKDADRWNVLGIKPIIYPQPKAHDYSTLYEGVRHIAKHVRHNVLDWQREIAAIAEKSPPLDGETADLIEDALEDVIKARFFTKAASDSKWIDWLDERGILNALFGDGTLSDRDQVLSWWLAKNFACSQADKLFLLIGKYNMRLKPHFWQDLVWTIVEENPPLDKDILSRWISLLLDTAPMPENADDDLLYQIGEFCLKHGMLDNLLQVFDTMTGSRLLIEESFKWPDDEDDNESPPVDVKLPLIGEDYQLVELWTDGLKPKLSQVSEPLLERVAKRLQERYLTLHAWQKVNREWDSESDSRAAIESHPQDWCPYPVYVLIDVARDCLEWLASNHEETALQWCIRHVDLDAPLLRRLAVHGVSNLESMTADDKIDWILTHIDLHDICAHHEIFQAVGKAYPNASLQYRKSLIKAVWDYCWRNDEYPQKEREVTAHHHFTWFDWLHKSDPSCNLAKQTLDRVSAEYPQFEPIGHPDLPSASRTVRYKSPWTIEELLAKPAGDWLDDLLSFPDRRWSDPDHRELLDRRELLVNVAGAVRQNFDWSLDLADALARTGEWDGDLWPILIQSWSKIELDEDKHSKALYWLGKTELYPEHSRIIAHSLYALMREGNTAYALNLLSQANKIAGALWHHLDQTEPIEEAKGGGPHLALNHPAGILAKFWLSGFSLWRKHQDPTPTTLNNEYRQILSDIVQNQKLPGKLGRTILAGHFAFLLSIDEAWTRENLLPLFAPANDNFQVVWDGFLAWGRLNPAVAEVMADYFPKAIERIDSDLSHQRRRFIKYYTDMLVHFAEEDPFDKWIPGLFQSGSQEAGQEFALNMNGHLRNRDEAAQQELWQRWLKQYWECRLQGVPAVLELGEMKNMLNWLPHLTAVFPEAVNLAVQMQIPQDISLRNWGMMIYKINQSDLWQNYPEEVAQLVIYLFECNLRYVKLKELIDKLLQLNISPKRKQELKEIEVQL